MKAYKIRGSKKCVSCKTLYDIQDVFSISYCPICNAKNSELLSVMNYLIQKKIDKEGLVW